MPSSKSARLFIALVVIAGFAVIANALRHPGSENPVRFFSFLLAACLAARMNVKLPGVAGVMSVNLPFILVAVAEMSTAEALVVACLSTLVQCLPKGEKKFSSAKTLFNIATIALAVGATRLLYNSAALGSTLKSHPLLLAVAAAGYFAANSLPVAVIIGLTENKNPLRAWTTIFHLSYPYYLASAGIAGVILTISAQVGWQVPVALLPLMLGVFNSYRRYFATAVAQAELKRAPQSATVAHAAS